MFLDQLTQEEKITYLRLISNAAKVNGDIAIEESKYIDEYRREMGIEPLGVLDSSIDLTKEIERVFSKSTKEHKRIVLFEAIAFMFVDGSYDKEEEKYITKFSEKIGISKDEVFEIEELVKKYAECVTEIAGELFK